MIYILKIVCFQVDEKIHLQLVQVGDVCSAQWKICWFFFYGEVVKAVKMQRYSKAKSNLLKPSYPALLENN